MVPAGTAASGLWWLAIALPLVLAVWASGHALLSKQDVAAAVGWTGVIWLLPFLGALLYWLFGINRVRRRAKRLRPGREGVGREGAGLPARAHPAHPHGARLTLRRLRPAAPDNLDRLSHLSGRLADHQLADGNAILPLVGGDQAYPAMLAAIADARRSIVLSSYILAHDRAGVDFAFALAQAVRRGVAVRVLLDALGSRYTRASMVRELRRSGVEVALFMPFGWPWRMPYLNLRNHRKILVVDGGIGFTGGMNIRQGCLASADGTPRIHDLHFRLTGPVVGHLMDCFAVDWAYTTGEELDGPVWASVAPASGPVVARGIADGPDEREPRIRWLILGALAEAQARVRVVTPYFLPDQALITALAVAALRGVAVDIVLPAKVNLRLVQWAAWARLGELLAAGCRIWLSPPPFDHSKLMTVDGQWSMLGSANWDARSLRLNFELNVEAYDSGLAVRLDRLIDTRLAAAKEVTVQDVNARGLPLRLRDGLCWLASPYL